MIKEIPLAAISMDENQPRKSINEKELQELAESIRTNGILQPILIRPIPGSKYLASSSVTKDNLRRTKVEDEKWEQCYRIVYGERRFRAAMIAGLETIRCEIRELTDEQAQEIQIVENLQRKDIAIMEEAEAFAALAKTQEMQEIALRVGKSAKYVSDRIKLTRLIPDFKIVLSQSRIRIKDALVIASIDKEGQKVIAGQLLPRGWREDESPISTHNLGWYVSRQTSSLSKAPFDIEDDSLYPDAGTCIGCKSNTSSSPLLFSELEDSTCVNSVCYNIKLQNTLLRKVEDALRDPEVVFIVNLWKEPSEIKWLRDFVESHGRAVLSYGNFTELEEPQAVGTWEEYLSINSDTGYTEKELREQYDEELKEWSKELLEYNEQIKSARKAFVLHGSDAGNYINITIDSDVIEADSENNKPMIPVDPTQKKINDLEEGEAQDQSEDREKIFERTWEEVKENYTSLNDQLHPEEMVALVMALCCASWELRRELVSELSTNKENYSLSGLELYRILVERSDDAEFFNPILRKGIANIILDEGIEDYEQDGNAAALQAAAKIFFPEKVAIFEQEQQELAQKRQEGVNKKIESLKKQLTDA